MRQTAKPQMGSVQNNTETTRRYNDNIARQYDAALRNIYDELYELNLTKNCYQIIYHVEGKYVIPAQSGVLSEAIRLVSSEMLHPDDKERFSRFFDMETIKNTFASGKECMIAEFRKLWVDGRFHWASITLFPVEHLAGDDEILLCFIMDIGDKKRADEMEEQNRLLKKRQFDDERYRIIVEQTKTLVFEWVDGENDNKRYYSEKLKASLAGDYDSGGDLLTIWSESNVVHPNDSARFEAFVEDIRSKAEQIQTTIRLKMRDGSYRFCKICMTCLYNSDGKLKRIVGTINDVDEAVKSEKALKYRAEYDMLTGIYNVQAFYSHAQRLLTDYPEKKYAVVRMDINRFKFINDIYGIEAGDRLLQYIAQIFKYCVSEHDVFGRVGGDVFCLCVAYEEENDLIGLVDKISKSLSKYRLGYKITPSFGICAVDDRNVPVSILCDWANLAMQTVKGNLVKTWAFYDDKLRARQLTERKIESEMEDALRTGQFEVYLQPKHNIASGKIIGAEALIRWNHPQEGLMRPNQFIPLFERNGFIIRLDEYVWEETCRILRSWLDRGFTPVPISVNVSRIHIYNPDFHEKLLSLLKKYAISPQFLELELTESTFIENPDELYELMGMLQKKGLNFSMDDFGTGYSSLNMLKDVPVDTIKLDRGFLTETAATRKGQLVVKYTISMAKQLDLNVIAEGVETENQAQFLQEAGCDMAQGFFFSKPMPVKDFESLVFTPKGRQQEENG